MSGATAAPEAAPPAKERLQTHFVTWHASAAGVHLRTDAHVLFIDKTKTDLIAAAKRIPRGQKIIVTGERTFSTILSTHVFAIDTLEVC